MRLFRSPLPVDLLSLLFLTVSLPARTNANDVLQTTGFDSCGANNATISVQSLKLSFDAANNEVIFDVAAESDVVQNVTASLAVYAYGKLVYTKDLDPCDDSTYIEQLCPGKYSSHRDAISTLIVYQYPPATSVQ